MMVGQILWFDEKSWYAGAEITNIHTRSNGRQYGFCVWKGQLFVVRLMPAWFSDGTNEHDVWLVTGL
jgi:hypothetical protein